MRNEQQTLIRLLAAAGMAVSITGAAAAQTAWVGDVDLAFDADAAGDTNWAGDADISGVADAVLLFDNTGTYGGGTLTTEALNLDGITITTPGIALVFDNGGDFTFNDTTANSITVDNGAFTTEFQNAVIFDAGAVGTNTITNTGTGALTFAGIDFNNVDATIAGTGAVTLGGAVANGGTLTVSNTGTVTLGDLVTATAINLTGAGTLATNGADHIADTTLVTVGADGTLQLGANETIGDLAGAGTVSLNGFDLTVLVTDADGTFTGTVNSNDENDILGFSSAADSLAFDFGGTITDTASVTVGDGVDAGGSVTDITVTLSTAQTTTGTLTVAADGAVTQGAAQSFGTIAGAGAIDLAGFDLTVTAPTGTYTGAVTGTTGADLNFSSAANGATFDFGGTIAAPVGLVVGDGTDAGTDGTADLTLTLSGTTAGNITVNGDGVLTTGGADVIGDTSVISILENGVVNFGGADTIGNFADSGTVTATNTNVNVAGNVVTVAAPTGTYTGQVTGTAGGGLVFNSAADGATFELAGTINGAVDITVGDNTDDGTAGVTDFTLTIGGDNSGTWTSGTILVQADGALVVSQATGLGGAFIDNASTGSVTGAGASVLGTSFGVSTNFNSGTDASFDNNVQFTNGTTLTFTGTDIAFGDALGDALSLTGGGALTLDGDATAFASSGTATFNGTWDDLTDTLTVGNFATIGGTGVLPIVTMGANSAINPGASVGNITVDTIDFAATAVQTVELAASVTESTGVFRTGAGQSGDSITSTNAGAGAITYQNGSFVNPVIDEVYYNTLAGVGGFATADLDNDGTIETAYGTDAAASVFMTGDRLPIALPTGGGDIDVTAAISDGLVGGNFDLAELIANQIAGAAGGVAIDTDLGTAGQQQDLTIGGIDLIAETVTSFYLAGDTDGSATQGQLDLVVVRDGNFYADNAVLTGGASAGARVLANYIDADTTNAGVADGSDTSTGLIALAEAAEGVGGVERSITPGTTGYNEFAHAIAMIDAIVVDSGNGQTAAQAYEAYLESAVAGIEASVGAALPTTVVTTVQAINFTTTDYLAAARAGGDVLNAYRASMNADQLTNNAEALDAMYSAGSSYDDSKWGVLVKGFGIFEERDDDGSTTGFDADIYGVIAGVDYTFNENFLAGLSFAYANAEVDLNANSGDIETDSFRIGAYTGYTRGVGQGFLYADLSASVGFHDNDSTRIAAGSNVGTYDSFDFTLFGELGYDYAVNDQVTVTPFANIQWTYYDQDGYAETGPSAITFGDLDGNLIDLRAGLKFAYAVQSGNITFVPEAEIGWDYALERDIDDVTATIGGGSFTTAVADDNDSAVFVGTGVTAQFDNNVSLFVRYDGEFGDNSDIHAVSGGLSLRF